MRFIVILFISFYLFSCSTSENEAEYPSLFPFVISYDAQDNVTNMAHLLDAPAGKKGFIRIVDGHFVDNAGRVWFNGTNLTGSANFPSHEQTDLLTERLARFGINCVRLHYMDANYGNFMEEEEQGIFTSDSTTQRNLDPTQMDRMDYMIAKFKEKGIYINMNLHVARKLDERDGFVNTKERPHLDKGVDNFYPEMIELQKEFAKDVMTHVNPYTGLAYNEEPSIAMVEINNENALFKQYFNGAIDKLPEPYSNELLKQWNEWLQKQYKSVSELSKSWEVNVEELQENYTNKSFPTISRDSTYSNVSRDFYKFIYDVEYDYWTKMYKYLKKDIGVKQVISGTQLRYTSPFLQAELDYVDIHAYWCHPSPVNPQWEIENTSMVNSMYYMYELAEQRINDKPYTISEYNHPFPNQYGAEGQPMLRAYGRLQGWDGVFQYTYNHRLDFEPNAMTYFFDMIARTDVLAHMPACAAIYLRGDVKESSDSVLASISHTQYFNDLAMTKRVTTGISKADYDPKLALIKKAAIELSESSTDNNQSVTKHIDDQIIISSTNELTWNNEKEGTAYWTINTSNTKLFTGFPDGRKIDLGGISLEIGKTRLDWATVSFVSRYASGFGESGKSSNILLTATGLVENKGMQIENVSDSKIRLSDWGEGPIQAEGISAKIILPSSFENTICYALDAHGNRTTKVEVKEVNNKSCEIQIGPEFQTIWYEIEIK